MLTGNKGEWSELYAFFKLLNDGKIYAADENVNRIDDLYLPIIRIIREEEKGQPYNYYTGDKIKVFFNDNLVEEIEHDNLEEQYNLLLNSIVSGGSSTGAFAIEGILPFMEEMKLLKIKAPSIEKKDITMQIQDINTGYSPVVGFSIKSDLGSPPTLFNSGKNTRVKYKITGFNDTLMDEINSIDKTVKKEYMMLRISKLFEEADSIQFDSIKDSTFEDNLVMLDSLMPSIYGEFVLLHYRHMTTYDCNSLLNILVESNPMQYKNPSIYLYKFKKFISAVALGMTAGKVWDGRDSATGGYIIIKRDGDVLCYHLYNRNFFEDYLLANTQLDRPSASKHDFAYVYKEDDKYYIDLNVQIRFKTIK